MVPVQVRRCAILREFTGEQQHRMFGISRDKTLHHIDTLYYSVFINEPEKVVELQNDNKLPENLLCFLQMLRENKAYLRTKPEAEVRYGELEQVVKSFSMYEYCISLNECFDIFIASYLPNEDTPRILVQLRSRYLVLEGVKKAIEESFVYLKEMLSPFGLFPKQVRENRIDYAFHTNLIQNPYKFFSDDHLLRHLHTNMRSFAKYGTITEDGIELETLNLGKRNSNNVYFRGYNKCQEVIRKNYKAFFFQRWFENGLISEFDKFVYETAYKLKSYRAGCLVGRLRWYIENGTNAQLVAECEQLLQTDFIKSDNCEHIEKKIHNIIPEPTLIFNIEYQTKRKFYATCSKWLDCHTDLSAGYLTSEGNLLVDSRYCSPNACDPLLTDIFTILFCARGFVDYLTGYGNCVSFVEDRSMSKKDFIEAGEPYQAWWNRIRHTPIDYIGDAISEVYRAYDRKVDIRRTRRLVQGQIARLSMLHNQSIKDRSFVEDMYDVLCILNDNDMVAFVPNPDQNGKIHEPKDYTEIRTRRARKLKGIIKEKPIEEHENPKTGEGEKI